MNIMDNYGWGLPVQASTYAKRIDDSLNILHVAMIVIFVLWAIFMVYCLVKYRSSKTPRANYPAKDSLAAYTPDVLILAFEIWLIFIVGIPIWAHIKEEFPKPEDAVVVNLTAQQFNWIFHYPGPDGKFGKMDPKLIHADNPVGLVPDDADGKDDFISVDQLHIPLGRPLLLNMTARDVIHSFFVPEFRVKQDAVPGMSIPLWVEPTRAGQYEIGCAQLCGTGHYRMRGDVFVTSPEEYDAWIQAKLKAKGL